MTIMKKALVLSVGTGTRPNVDITQPLIFSIKIENPDLIGFLYTEKSESHKDKIIRELGIKPDEFTGKKIHDVDDLNLIFNDICDLLEDIIQRGFQPEHITVDFTSGTKPMSAGLVLAAVRYNCKTLSYISGERTNGVVTAGKEKRLAFSLYAWFSADKLSLARNFIKLLQFDSALYHLEQVKPELLRSADQQLRQHLLTLAQAYKAWDDFDHKQFMSQYKAVDANFSSLQEFLISDEVKSLLGEKIISVKVQKNYTPEIIADVVNNAERRFISGRYDDAVARLYRAIEMLAQYCLKKEFGIDSSDVDLNKIPDSEYRKKLETKREPINGKIKIGLRDAYELLEKLGHSLGKDFTQNSKLQHQLSKRNSSITAHGLQSITMNDYQELKTSAYALFEKYLPEFNNLTTKLQFPWLKT